MEQWAAIPAYCLSLEPLASNSKAAPWQEDTPSGLCFTECYDYLLKDIAKKHSRMLACLGTTLPLTVPVAPTLATNNLKFRSLILHINLHVELLMGCSRF